jgi:hypothetical protein
VRLFLPIASTLIAGVLIPFGGAGLDVPGLVRATTRATGLHPTRPVRVVVVPAATVDRAAAAQASRVYPMSARRDDAVLYQELGLTGSLEQAVRRTSTGLPAVYDSARRRVLVRRGATSRLAIEHEIARALVDAKYRLSRLAGLRARDRDAALAAVMATDGIASLTGGLPAAPALSDPPATRFVKLESRLAASLGAQLMRDLRFYGGSFAVSEALAHFPVTTNQAMHLDAFLERRPPQAVKVPAVPAGSTLLRSQTFGELDLRSLLGTFGLAGAAEVAAGWAGGRSGLYRSAGGALAAALSIVWATDADAARWLSTVPPYLDAAFDPSPATPSDCGPATCWTAGDRTIAAIRSGRYTVVASSHDARTATAIAAEISTVVPGESTAAG